MDNNFPILEDISKTIKAKNRSYDTRLKNLHAYVNYVRDLTGDRKIPKISDLTITVSKHIKECFLEVAKDTTENEQLRIKALKYAIDTMYRLISYTGNNDVVDLKVNTAQDFLHRTFLKSSFQSTKVIEALDIPATMELFLEIYENNDNPKSLLENALSCMSYLTRVCEREDVKIDFNPYQKRIIEANEIRNPRSSAKLIEVDFIAKKVVLVQSQPL